MIDPALKYARLAELARALDKAHRRSIAAAAARGALPYGATRARVTTANARWSIAAEERDRALDRFQAEYTQCFPSERKERRP